MTSIAVPNKMKFSEVLFNCARFFCLVIVQVAEATKCKVSINEIALKDHVFFTFSTESIDLCYKKCKEKPACQSINYYFRKSFCELNNRTIENRPLKKVKNQAAVYFQHPAPVTVGSHQEAPAESCIEIKNTTNNAISDFYWIKKANTSTQKFCGAPEVENCKSYTNLNSGELLLDATGPGLTVCRAVYNSAIAPSVNYRIDVDIYTYRTDNSLAMHPGLVFNVQDKSNMDLVYFRTHETCGLSIQAGKLIANSFSGSPSTCQVSTPPGYAWFQAAIEVNSSSVKLFVNGVHASTFTPHFPLTKRGGVMVFNSFNNLVKTRRFRIVNL